MCMVEHTEASAIADSRWVRGSWFSSGLPLAKENSGHEVDYVFDSFVQLSAAVGVSSCR
jgi:hypothetical protein